MTSRRKPGVAFWATVVIAAGLVLYPLSFGPACWLAFDGHLSQTVVAEAYRPVIRAANMAPAPIRDLVTAYSGARPFAFSLSEPPGMLGLLTEILDGEIKEI